MKLFGRYIFEDDPELLAYRAEKRQRQIDSDARACENYGRPNGIALPQVEFGDLTIGGIPVSQKRLDKEHLRQHREWAEKGRCHLFNGKKYCYHKGVEIVTSQEASAKS